MFQPNSMQVPYFHFLIFNFEKNDPSKLSSIHLSKVYYFQFSMFDWKKQMQLIGSCPAWGTPLLFLPQRWRLTKASETFGRHIETVIWWLHCNLQLNFHICIKYKKQQHFGALLFCNLNFPLWKYRTKLTCFRGIEWNCYSIILSNFK